MKKLIPLVLILCMACMLVSAVADDDISGDWYASYFGMPMTMTLNADGTASMAAEGVGDLGTATWTLENGKFTMTETENGMVSEGTYIDGVLALDNDGQLLEFTREPVQGITIAEVNPEAAAEDFEGKWAPAYVNFEGMTLDAAASGVTFGVIIENSSLRFEGEAESMTFFVGTDAIPMAYENGALNFSVELANDAAPMTITLRAEILQDGMLALVLDTGMGSMTVYFVKAAAEEPAA